MAIKIGLDPGHGGNSPGTNSIDSAKDGIYEKTYALELCQMIAERLIRAGFEVFMTRTGDTKPGNVSERALACVATGCDYAVSVHFNGSANAAANGCEVFVPYKETFANIEVGYYNGLSRFFKIRKPFARSTNINNRNETTDKRMNLDTKRFEVVANKKEYFGFIRTAWEKGLSADLLEVCFLTNRLDFDTYIEHKAEIADALAAAIVEGFGKQMSKPETPKPAAPKPKRIKDVDEKGKVIFR